MENKYSVRFNDYEIRTEPINNNDIHLVKWNGDHCYSLGYFKEGKDGDYDFRMVGHRFYSIEPEDLPIIINMIKSAHEWLDQLYLIEHPEY